MAYYPKVKSFHAKQEQHKFNLIDDFALRIQLHLLRKEMTPNHHSTNILSIEVPALKVKMSPSIYRSLLELPSHVSFQQVEVSSNVKQTLLANALKINEIHILEDDYVDGQQWTRYQGVLAGGYIYLYARSTDLVFTRKLYLRNSLVKPTNDPLQLSLLNVHDNTQVFIKFNRLSHITNWHTALQTKQYSQVIQHSSTSTSTSISTSKQQTFKIDYQQYVQVTCCVQQLQLSLVNQSSQPMYSFKTKEIDMTHLSFYQKTEMTVKVCQVLVDNHLCPPMEETLQYLLYTPEDLMTILVSQVNPLHPSFKDTLTSVSVNLQPFHLNYHPDSLLYLLSFFKNTPLPPPPNEHSLHSSISFLPPPDTQPDDSPSITNHNHTSLSLTIELVSIQLNLIHRQNHLLLNTFTVSSSSFSLSLLPLSIQLHLVISNLQISECTNYPLTLLSPSSQHPLPIQQLLGRSDHSEHPLLTVSFSLPSSSSSPSSSPSSPSSPSTPSTPSTPSQLTLTLHQLSANVLLQPLLRLVDYIQYQIIELLTNQQMDVHSLAILAPRDPIHIQQQMTHIRQLLSQPKLMSMNININQPQLILTSHHSSDQLILFTNQINITNRPFQSSHRLSNSITDPSQSPPDIWNEEYLIVMKQVQLQTKQADKLLELSEQLDLTLKIEMLKMKQEYEIVLTEWEIDSAMKVNLEVTPLVVSLQQHQYNCIMEVITNSVLLDDTHSSHFHHGLSLLTDFIHNAQVKPTPKETPLLFQLTIQQMHLFLLDSTNQPLFRLMFHQIALNQESRTAFSKTSLLIDYLNFSYFLPGIDDNLIEHHLLGHVLKPFSHSIPSQPDINHYITTQYLLQQNPLHQNNLQFVYTTIPQIDFIDKDLFVQLQNLSIKINIAQYIHLLSFFTQNQKKQKDQVQKKVNLEKKQEQQSEQQQWTQKVRVNIQNGSILMECVNKINMLGSRGDISLVLISQSAPSEAMIIKQHEERSKKTIGQRLMEQNQVDSKKLNVSLHEMDIFICEIQSVESLPFPKVKKRHLILPFELSFILNEKLTLLPNSRVTPHTKVHINVESLNIRASIRDILLINHTYQLQMSPLKEFSTEKTEEEEEEEIEKKQSLHLHGQVYINEVNILVVNDQGAQLAPLVELKSSFINQVMTIKDQVQQGTIVMSLQVDYFNPNIALFEPLIEETRLTLDFALDSLRPHTFIHIEQNLEHTLQPDIININISTQMIHVLLNLLNSIHRRSQEKADLMDSTCQYKVENQTGYPLQVLKQSASNDIRNILQLAPGSTANLEFSSQEDKLIKFRLHSTHLKYPQFIQKINLERIRIKKISLIYEDMVLVLSSQLREQQKVLTISSPLLFINESQLFPLGLLLISSDNTLILDHVLSPQSQYHIPVDLINNNIKLYAINPNGLNHISNQMSLLKLLQYPDKCCMDIQLEQQTVVMKVQKECKGKGKTIVSLESPIQITNCIGERVTLLVKEDQMQLEKDAVYESRAYSSTDLVYLGLNLQPGLDNWPYFQEDPQHQRRQRVTIKSYETVMEEQLKGIYHKIDTNNQQTFSLYYSQQVQNVRSIYLFVEGVIYNETGVELEIWGKELKRSDKSRRLENSQSDKKRFFFHQENMFGLRVGKGEEGRFNANVIQEQELVVKLGGGREMEVGVTVDMCKISHGLFIMYKSIRLNPRLVIVNSCNHPIEYRQSFQITSEVLQIDNRIGLVWSHSTADKTLQIKHQQAAWSDPLNVSHPGLQLTQIDMPNHSKAFFWIDVRQDNDILYIVINTTQQLGKGFILDNRLPVEVTLKQSNTYQQKLTTVLPNSQEEFGWASPSMTDKQIDLMVNQETLLLSPDALNTVITKHIDDLLISVSIQVEGITKRIVVTTDNAPKVINMEQQEGEGEGEGEGDRKVKNLSLKLPQVGISIIDNLSVESTYELLYIYLSCIELCIMEKEQTKVTQFRVQYINIDHNKWYLMEYPVILTPLENQSRMKEADQYVLNVCFQQRTGQLSNVFDFIRVDLHSLAVRVEYYLIDNLAQLYSSMTSMLVQHSSPSPHLSWHIAPLPPNKTQTFINEVTISPFNLQLTFKYVKQRKQGMTSHQQLMSRLDSFIMVSNIDEVPLHFDGIGLKTCLDDTRLLKAKIIAHYRHNLTYQVLKLLGSLDLIGNPLGLLNNFKVGIKDAITKPIEGFVQGPLELSRGIVQGTNSLVSNTVGGTFNSIKKISKTMAQGIGNLSMDPEYIKQREELRAKKPKNLDQSLQQASMGLFHVFEQSVTGLVTKPLQGAKNEGVKGFFSGGVKSVFGIVVNPITGIMDAISKTAEGIQNEFKNQDDLSNEKRLRDPRPFYSYNQYFTTYDQQAASTILLLQKFKNGKYFINQIFLDSIFLPELNQVIVFTEQGIINLDMKNKWKQWYIHRDLIIKIDIYNDGVKIYLTKNIKIKSKNIKTSQVSIQLKNSKIIKQVKANLEYLIELKKEV